MLSVLLGLSVEVDVPASVFLSGCVGACAGDREHVAVSTRV